MLTQVKYLEIILDKGLTWKQHVQHILNKAHRIFWVNHGSETNDDILDVHRYGKTNCFLCCPDMVVENQKEGMHEQTH